MDQIVNPPNPPLLAMQLFKTENESSIRKSITRTGQAEREQRIKDRLATPTRPPRTPKQELALSNFPQLVHGSSIKKWKRNRMQL